MIQVTKDDNGDWLVERREGSADQHYAITVTDRWPADEPKVRVETS